MPTSVFANRNIIAPTKQELRWGLLCWIVYLFLPIILSVIPYFSGDSIEVVFHYNITISVVTFLLIAVCFRPFLYRSRLPFLLLFLTCLFGFLGSQGLGGLWNIFLSILRSLLPGETTNMNQELVNEFLLNYKGAMLIDVILFAPFIEEILFRGLIFAPLCKKKPFLAYAVSMACFAFFHVYGFIGSQSGVDLLFSFLQYLPAGFVLCWSYQRSQSIWAPMTLHGILNLISASYILA